MTFRTLLTIILPTVDLRCSYRGHDFVVEMALFSHFVPTERSLQDKFWLILTRFQDSDSPADIPSRTKNPLLFRAIFTFWLVFSFPFLLGLSYPETANAGIFSLVSSFFEKSKTDTIKEVNSQTMPLLKAVLNGDPDYAKGGGEITIIGKTALLSETGPSGTSADISSQTQNGEISLYVVREGDSLSQIATMFGVSINTIIWANDLNRASLITPGQTLVILPISGVRYTIKSGDTLQSVAKKYDGDVDEIISFNDLPKNGKLSIEEEITIPNGVLQSSPSKSTSIVKSSGLPSYSGYYMRPLIGGRKTQGIHGYNGIDFGAPTGTDILAAADGQVVVSKNSGWNGGYGSYTAIKHPNGTQTLYAHASNLFVSVGQYVSQGQVIGLVGSTGRSTGPHLHFEVRGATNPF